MFAVLVPQADPPAQRLSFPRVVVGSELPAGGDDAGRAEVLHPPAVVAWRRFALATLTFTTLVILSLAVRTIAGIARGELRELTL
jgi:hypothetical protein